MVTVSTDFPVKVAHRMFKLIADSTVVISSTNAIAFTANGLTGIPGFDQSTADTYVNYPVTYPGEDMFFNIIYDSPCTNSTIRYAAAAVQLRCSTLGGFHDSTGGSTKQSAFEYALSTAVFDATSTGAQSYMLGPVDTLRYGQPTSTGTYIKMLVGFSTASKASTTAISTLAAMATNAPIGSYFVKPITIAPPYSTKYNV